MDKEGISKSTRNLTPLDKPAEAPSAPAPAPFAPAPAPAPALGLAATPAVAQALPGLGPTPAPQPAPPPHKELTAEEVEMLDGVALPDDIDDAHDEILR